MRRALFVIACIAVAASAHAGDRTVAAAKYKEGEAAFARKDFAQAADAFERAYREDPRGASVYNAALAWQALGTHVRAADDFEIAMRANDLLPELLDNAKAQLQKLDTVLARVHIVGPADAKLTGAGVAVPSSPPLAFRAEPGRYAIRIVYADGHAEDKPFEASVGAVEVDVTPATSGASSAPIAEHEPTELRGLLGTASLPIGITLVAASAVFIAGWVGFGLAAVGANNEWTASNLTLFDAHDRAVTYRTVTDVSAVLALVTATAGVVTLVTLHKVPVRVGLGGVSISGTF